jgi:FkbM family methyltransferase
MLPLNHNVYECIAAAGMQSPDIPVRAVEYYAQCGEDVIVLALLRAIALREGLDLSRERYLEIGANHPVATSATWLLHRALGMTGVLVEANPRLIEPLRAHRPHDHVLHAAVHVGPGETIDLHVSNQSELSSLDADFVRQWRQGVVGEREVVRVPAIRVDDLLSRHFPDRPPAFVSIDIEGMDLAVLRDMDAARHRPMILQAEPSDHHHPHNTEAIADHLASIGYVVVARTEVNLISVDAARLGLPTAGAPSGLAERKRQAEEQAAALARALATQADLGQAVTAARNEAAAARSEAAAARSEAAAARAALAQAQAAMQGILTSNSWRITAPLRAAIRLARGGRG